MLFYCKCKRRVTPFKYSSPKIMAWFEKPPRILSLKFCKTGFTKTVITLSKIQSFEITALVLSLFSTTPFSSNLIPSSVFQTSTGSKVSIRLSCHPPTPNHHSCPLCLSQLNLLAPFSLLPWLPPHPPPPTMSGTASLFHLPFYYSHLHLIASKTHLSQDAFLNQE